MSDERLRLVVELQNKASAEIKNIISDMGKVKPSAGMAQTQTWFNRLSSASDTATKSVRPLVGGLNMIGAGGLAAGLSIAGLAKQFVDLAKSLPALQELSRQTGMSRTEIERLKAAASNLNIDPSKMQASLSSFSRMMVDFHKRHGDLYEEMANHGASGLAEKIRKEDPAAAYRDVLKWLDAIPEAQKRAGKSAADAVQIQRHWAGEAFGDEDMAQIVSKGMRGFQEAYQQAAQDIPEITDAVVKQAEAFDRSISRFDASWESLKRDLGTSVLPAMTATTDGMRALFDELKHDPELLAIGGASLGALYARARILKAASGGGAGGGIAPATAAKIEGAAVEQVKADATFAEAVAEFRLGVREMVARGAVPGGPGTPVPAEPVKPGVPDVAKEAPKGFLGGGGFKGLASGLAEGVVGGIVYDYGEKAMDALLGWTAGNQKTLDHATSLGTVYKDVKDQWFGGSPSHPDDDREARLRRTERQRLMREPLEGGLDRMRTEMTGQRQGVPTAFQPIPSHPDDDRLSRARAADAPDRTLDGVVVGALGKEVIHLTGTLRTATASMSGDGIRPAAFHPASLGAALAAGGPADTIAAAVKEGTLAAFREWAGTQDLDAKGGVTPASFGGGGASSMWGGAAGRGGHAGSANMRYGGAGHSPGQDSYTVPTDERAGTTQDNGAGFTAGMRARNLGNIGYFGQHTPGLVGPSNAHDVDHSIGLFATQEDGIRAAANLALKKYEGGRHSAWDLIAAKGGWTPGALGPGASKNIAAAMGLDNQSDMHLDQPGQMHKFLHGLAMQEHGKAGAFYSDALIDRALSGRQTSPSAGGGGSLGSKDPVGIAEGMLGANGSRAQVMLQSRMTPGL